MRVAESLRALLARPLLLLAAAIVMQWLTTLAVGLRAEGLSLGAVEVVTPVVLGPVAVVCVHRLGLRIGGPALAAWAVLVWVAVPWLARALTLGGYDETLRDSVLPLALGLTDDPGYAAGVVLLSSAALLTFGDPRAAAAAGAIAGVAMLLSPSAVLFAVPAVLALAAVRRPRAVALFAAAAVPLLAAALLWRGGLSFEGLSLDRLRLHSAGLREHFASQRVLQWLPVAGVLAVARGSAPFAILLGGWLAGYVALRAPLPGTGYENGDLFRVLLPALPAYVLLAAALPLLVPTLATRLGPLGRPVESR